LHQIFGEENRRFRLAAGAAKGNPVGMPKQRIDLSTPEAPTVSAVVTVAMRDRLTELAAVRGTSRSAAVRELLESALDAEDDE
jgi:hypothetical protein